MSFSINIKQWIALITLTFCSLVVWSLHFSLLLLWIFHHMRVNSQANKQKEEKLSLTFTSLSIEHVSINWVVSRRRNKDNFSARSSRRGDPARWPESRRVKTSYFLCLTRLLWYFFIVDGNKPCGQSEIVSFDTIKKRNNIVHCGSHLTWNR